MNKRMIKSKLRCLRRILLLCLCAVMLTGSALAEDVADISGEGFDCMYYKCTLPDGRVILTGWKGTVGNYMDSRARILCLNPGYDSFLGLYRPVGRMLQFHLDGAVEGRDPGRGV